MYIKYTWYTTQKYQYWVRAISGRFKKKNSEWDLDPTTHFHSNLKCLKKKILWKAPYREYDTCAYVRQTYLILPQGATTGLLECVREKGVEARPLNTPESKQTNTSYCTQE